MDPATLLALLRGLHLASTLSLLGVIGFIAWVLPAAKDEGRGMWAPLIRLWWVSGAAALVTGAAWFILQSVAIAGAASLVELAAALPVVGEHTRYGQTMLVRAGLLLAATLLASRSRFRLYLALVLSIVALGLQGFIGHAGAMSGRVGDGIMASESLHLAAAGLWLGALVPLGLSLGRLPPSAGAAVCERFSPIGLACVLVLAGTGLAQGSELIGSIPALFGTHYGRIALLKIGLFIVALALAALNRIWLTDRLTGGHGEEAELAVAQQPFHMMSWWNARTWLRLSVIIETLIGLAIILAAAFMASASPASHEQPIWPFSWRFSLVTVNEDADARREVIVSLGLIGVAVLLLVAAFIWGRFKLLALAVLAGTVAVRASSFTLLTVEAYPTSFQTSPTDFSASSIVRGQALYARDCVSCHGVAGKGNGPAASGLRIKPADLTMPHLWEHSDGALFWWVTHGIDDPEGGLAMPGFAMLSAADRWALIDYVRAHNAGVAMQLGAAAEVPVAAPALPVRCTGIKASRTTDLRGHVVHVVTDGTEMDQRPIPPQLGISVIPLDLRLNDGETTPPPPQGACVVATRAAWQAYAILANLPPDKLSGSEFLIGPDGWLRAERGPDKPNGWHTRDDLIATVRGICARPLHQTNRGEHEHHH
ncbi:CopD family protein [Rhodopila sp.]|uniref:CopD family protein n=1 Tax=Rhodopila sp. TaxID=2480087 RepID=UPI003D0F9844